MGTLTDLEAAFTSMKARQAEAAAAVVALEQEDERVARTIVDGLVAGKDVAELERKHAKFDEGLTAAYRALSYLNAATVAAEQGLEEARALQRGRDLAASRKAAEAKWSKARRELDSTFAALAGVVADLESAHVQAEACRHDLGGGDRRTFSLTEFHTHAAVTNTLAVGYLESRGVLSSGVEIVFRIPIPGKPLPIATAARN